MVARPALAPYMSGNGRCRATRAAPDHHPRGFLVQVLPQLLEDGLRNVVVALPVGGSLRVRELRAAKSGYARKGTAFRQVSVLTPLSSIVITHAQY